jgi:hypothetical protein
MGRTAAFLADARQVNPPRSDPTKAMNRITTSSGLLDIPVHSRQTLIVVDDPVLQEIEGHASVQPGEPANTDQQTERLTRLLGGAFVAAGPHRVGRAAIGRGRELLRASAGRAGGAPPALMPALAAIGVMGIGTVAVLLLERDGIPVDVTFVSATAARNLTFSEGPFKVGGVYAAHPKHAERYLPWDTYSRLILHERAREAASFFVGCCGASRVETLVEQGDDLSVDVGISDLPWAGSAKWNAKLVENTTQHRVIEGPGRLVPEELVPADWTWFDDEPEWQEIHDLRRDLRITSHELTTVIKDERLVTGKALSKIPAAKLNLNATVKRHKTTRVKWKVSFPHM